MASTIRQIVVFGAQKRAARGHNQRRFASGRWRRRCCAAMLLSGLAAGPAAAQSSSQSSGAEIYLSSHCYVCHGEGGYGGVGPRFRDDAFLGATDYVIAQILVGRGIMPAFDYLNNQQIAAVATYIRSSWGNQFGQVNPKQVAEVRNTLKTQIAKQQGGAAPEIPWVPHP